MGVGGLWAADLAEFKCFLLGLCPNPQTWELQGLVRFQGVKQDVVFFKRLTVIQQVQRSVEINWKHPLENRRFFWRLRQQGTICACWDKTEGMSIPPAGKYSSDRSIGCSVSRSFHHLLAAAAGTVLVFLYPLKSWNQGKLVRKQHTSYPVALKQRCRNSVPQVLRSGQVFLSSQADNSVHRGKWAPGWKTCPPGRSENPVGSQPGFRKGVHDAR